MLGDKVFQPHLMCLHLIIGQARERAAPGLGAGPQQGEDAPDPEVIQGLGRKVLAAAVDPLGETRAGVAPRRTQGRGADLGLRIQTLLHTAMYTKQMSQ